MLVSVFGKVRSAVAGVSRPLDLARKYDQKHAKKFVAARINGGMLWDMQRPLPAHTTAVEFLRFDGGDAAAKEVFWHSSAHVLGAALENIYGDDVLLCDGPALPEGGFFYEFLLLNPSARPPVNRLDGSIPYHLRIDQLCGASVPQGSLKFLSADDLAAVDKAAAKVIVDQHEFVRMEVAHEVACEIFLDNPFKLRFLSRARQAALQAGISDAVSLYRCGTMIDLCRGPHAVCTTQLQAFSADRVSSAHWVGHLHDQANEASDAEQQEQQRAPVLNRVYGLSFPDHNMLKEHKRLRDAAARRDHRVIGRDQKLFMMHPWAPGSGFILPHGQRMVNTILAAIRRKYAEYGFDEVSTPLMFNRRLWETSGHWENYRDDMFAIAADVATGGPPVQGCCGHDDTASSSSSKSEPEFGLKPMNCPGHCLIFASEQRSHRDLPIRYADFSPLHRNEVAGALSGLTRVRKFHQDDGHIFCARDQVAGEIESCLRLIGEIYRMLGFASYELALSTRPAKFMGEPAEWDEAEAALRDALDKSGKPWVLNACDGAFYGPKIDVRVQDALGRQHQTATIQLDFQLPQRFQLKYTGPDGKQHRPVMIHRAVLGSMERMLAVLIEHWGGKWPFWVNPRQAIVIPTTVAASGKSIVDYAQRARDTLAGDTRPESVDSHRYFVDVDLSGNTLGRSVREAQLAQYTFILVVGEQELAKGTVDIRQRGGARLGSKTVAETRAMFQELIETYK
ncbi:hypothetical protein LPJ61_002596 [Coemansia biformis]|uniref:threonine--tRNA ligase n=1 Tax=Coemansia biformis TaxID=1286918 RepID=A0A9W7YDS2_9FUNG|nr:hypothetical protein LPJ61_002596 [Coemansia biformis]